MLFSSMNVQLLLVVVVVIFEVTATGSSRYPVCVTPNGENGRCKPLGNCKVLLQAVLHPTAQSTEFRKNSKCGPPGLKMVCCGSTASPSTPPPPKAEEIISLSPLSEETLCGVHALPYKILGGTATDFSELPWLAAVEFNSTISKTSVGIRCGGSIINTRYVLTAAHCLNHIELVVTKVWLGATNISSDGNCIYYATGTRDCVKSIKKLDVDKAISHSHYDDSDGLNDIGLLRLKNEIIFGSYIRPICLPSSNLPPPTAGTNMTVAGWGATEHSKGSDIKLKVEVPLQNNSICSAFVSKAHRKVASDQLCVGGARGKDACNGDSGGPLMTAFRNANGKTQWYQAGIVSYGSGCGVNKNPTIYTRVSQYEEWITMTINGPK